MEGNGFFFVTFFFFFFRHASSWGGKTVWVILCCRGFTQINSLPCFSLALRRQNKLDQFHTFCPGASHSINVFVCAHLLIDPSDFSGRICACDTFRITVQSVSAGQSDCQWQNDGWVGRGVSVIAPLCGEHARRGVMKSWQEGPGLQQVRGEAGVVVGGRLVSSVALSSYWSVSILFSCCQNSQLRIDPSLLHLVCEQPKTKKNTAAGRRHQSKCLQKQVLPLQGLVCGMIPLPRSSETDHSKKPNWI